METMFADVGVIFSAILSGDSWEFSQASRGPGAWPVGLVAMLLSASFVVVFYRFVPAADRHLERVVMVWTYLIIAGIIFVEVFRRFVLGEQAPWSTTLPPFLFLIMTWFGCSFNVGLRTHLAFGEFRTKLPRLGQLLCLGLDAFLWLVFCWVVIVTSTRVTANSAANFQILLGTDDTLQWWFLATVPIAFILLAARVLENLIEDVANYRSGQPLIRQAIIGAD